jgi:hypothetical protein
MQASDKLLGRCHRARAARPDQPTLGAPGTPRQSLPLQINCEQFANICILETAVARWRMIGTFKKMPQAQHDMERCAFP